MTIVDFGAFLGCQLKLTMAPKELENTKTIHDTVSQYLYFSTCIHVQDIHALYNKMMHALHTKRMHSINCDSGKIVAVLWNTLA